MEADAGTHILVGKSIDDIEKIWPAAVGALGRGALSLLGRGGAKAAAGKGAQVGAKGVAGASAGGIAPAAGGATTALQPTSATAGTSMSSNSSAQGAAQAAPVKVQPSQPAQGGNIFDEPVKHTQYEDAMKEVGLNPVDKTTPPARRARSKPAAAEMTEDQTTLRPDDPTLQTAVEESQTKKKIGQLEGNQKSQEEAQRRRDKLQNIAGTGYIGVTTLQQRRAQKDAEERAEMERLQSLAEDGRAKAGTGGKVAVAA